MKYETHNDLRDKPIMSMYSFNRDSFSKATPQAVEIITTTMTVEWPKFNPLVPVSGQGEH